MKINITKLQLKNILMKMNKKFIKYEINIIKHIKYERNIIKHIKYELNIIKHINK